MPRDPCPDRRPDDPGPAGPGSRRAGETGPGTGSQAGEQGLFVCLPAEELTLAGFAQDGRSDTMAPGALLATLLEAVAGDAGSGLAGLDDDQLIGVISAVRRMESRTAWMLMAGLAELARRRPASGDHDDRGQYGFSDFAPDEVAAELRLSVQSAAGQMMYAVAVEDRLPASFAALAEGKIHPVHLRIIEDETRILSPEQAAQADEILAEAARSATFGQLRYAARRLVLKLDADAARRRKETAARREAEVRRFREDSGNAGMIARELPPAEVLASWQHVDQRAHDLRAAGMPGSLRELRIRAYLDLLQERDSRLAPVASDTGQDQPAGDGTSQPPDQGSGPAGNGGPGPQPGGNDGPGGPHGTDGSSGSGPDGGPGGTGGPGSGPQGGPASPARQAGRDQGPSVAALINITVPLDTLLGRSATPGEAAGFGPLDPGDARALVAAAARHPQHPVVRDRPAPRRHRRRPRVRPRPPPPATRTRPHRRRPPSPRTSRPGPATRP